MNNKEILLAAGDWQIDIRLVKDQLDPECSLYLDDRLCHTFTATDFCLCPPDHMSIDEFWGTSYHKLPLASAKTKIKVASRSNLSVKATCTNRY